MLNTYYKVLENSQKSGMDVTAWLEWFLACLVRALERFETTHKMPPM
jgi:Fic family protein